MTITITIQDSQFTEFLAELRKKTTDMSVVMGDIGEYLLLSHQDRWQKQVSADGKPWLPLSREYESSPMKMKSRGRGKILTLHGYLKDLNYLASRRTLRFGTKMNYGATHQFGNASKGIPARPFLGISTEDQTEIARLVSAFITEGD